MFIDVYYERLSVVFTALFDYSYQLIYGYNFDGQR